MGVGHEKGEDGQDTRATCRKGILSKYSRVPPLPPDAPKGLTFHVLMPPGQVTFMSGRWTLNGDKPECFSGCFMLVIRGHGLSKQVFSFPSCKYHKRLTTIENI